MNPGDRVRLRDRAWKVRKVGPPVGERLVIEVEAVDGEEPATLSVVVPPEDVALLPPEEIRFSTTALDSYAAWAAAHRVLAATLARETGILSGARFGRVILETYQLAPTLRLLSKPRPRLLVADDVGLGKTIEAGLAILELMARGRARRTLIVTPPGLLLQWQEELLEKFGLRFTVIENAAGLARAQTDLPAGVSPWDALPRVLTSMDYLKKETIRARALRKRWDLVVVDEAHALAESGTPRNPYRTQRTRLGLALREASRGLVLLTATPHNGYLHSFRSLLELVEPAASALRGEEDAVSRRVQRAMIRRMKAQIRRRLDDGSEEAVFPPRTVRPIPIVASEEERDLLAKVGSYCSRTARQASGQEDEELVGFAMQIIKKRALSSRAALAKTLEHRIEALRKEEAREAPPQRAEIRDLQADLPLGEAAAERTARRILRSAVPKDERRRKAEIKALNAIRRLLKKLPAEDPKIEALIAEIQAMFQEDPTERVIVFTEYRDTLASLQERLESLPDLRGRWVVLTGGLSLRQRLRRQEAFEQEGTRLLLATDAASEGLNLQRACRRVLHFELPWNPNRLEQRNGRVDRYGQRRPPRIGYLYYPDSPEEDVLHHLVSKIETIGKARVSTPDILGVLSGAGDLDRRLVELDPAQRDLEVRKNALVRHFDDRTAEFVREVQPFLLGGVGEGETARVLELLDTTEPLLPAEGDLEDVVGALLGPGNLEPTETEGVQRLRVPLAFRGPQVREFYPAVTFRRETAVRSKADEVEYMTPLHPLVRSLASAARRCLLQVFEGERGLPPRRLAALRLPPGEPASVLFTFLAAVGGGGDLHEERLLALRVDLGGRVLGAPEENLAFLEWTVPGEVSARLIEKLFASSFEQIARKARREAEGILARRVEDLRRRRAEQASLLLEDLERDLVDRLREITEEERRARGLLEEETGQQRLFPEKGEGARSFEARRAAAAAGAGERRREIEEFARVEPATPPRPMGALFLVPAEVAAEG